MAYTPTQWTEPGPPWVSAENMNKIEAGIDQAHDALDSQVIDQTQAPTTNAGSVGQVLDWFANLIRGITGELDWKNVPATTLKSAKTHIDDAAKHVPGGGAAGEVLTRQAGGSAAFQAPAALPQRVAPTGPFPATYTLALAANTWTRMNNGTNNAPRLDFAALPAPPSGTAWRIVVSCVFRVSGPAPTSVDYGAQINAGAMGNVNAGVRVMDASIHYAPLVLEAAAPTDGLPFTVDFGVRSSVAGTYSMYTVSVYGRAFLVST